MRAVSILIAFAASMAFAVNDCSVATIQALIDTVVDTDTTATVAFAQRIDSNETLATFETLVGARNLRSNLTDTCGVRVNANTTSGSNYAFGVLLPDVWYQRIMAAAPAAGIDWGTMSAAAQYQYAIIGSNGGHDEIDYDPDWVTPNGLIDYGYLAVHESTVLGKALIKAWYGNESVYNYFTGCSVGGRHAFKQIEMYPEDYDGVMAGSPAWWTTHQQLFNLKQTTYQAPAGSDHTIPADMFSVIAAEVLRQCDPQDGNTDLVISDPYGCNFNPLTLACGANKSTQCLTSLQLQTLYKIQNDWVDVNQTFVYPHVALGSEATWAGQIGTGTEQAISNQYWYIQNLLGLKNFTWEDLAYSTVQLADQLDPGNATADDFDLSPFYSRGGKLIHWHGLSDATVSPGASIYFHDHVAQTVGANGIDVDDFYQLYLVPGLEHCGGTPSIMNAPWYIAGPSQASYFTFIPDNVVYNTVHDMTLTLASWVEGGRAPEYIVATGFTDNTNPVELSLNRRVCPYPQQAYWLGPDYGTGSYVQEDNWNCSLIYGSSFSQ
ncbi:hypothetical protein PFICI_05116 [Pestalotiopsis fici W106-1]|uniref:Carboxylic ester hydrolase n=1 Tax=Pestalotiopsis fici (strain W106-1 / CGMCC3.15140) TaxID=1229662 RepID=W3XB34_PESFW|nr:uncharacterized protein PFICI_05116 [Pestalotiopsis fici W106-1]ETS83240.1 hypothetical protein PFICI_05116 [Pestalotiopsis fici W106-1]